MAAHGREALRFRHQVEDQRPGHDGERRPVGPVLPGAARVEEREHHDGLAETHVVGQDAAGADLVMSHLSVNFDRSGFQEDWNVVFPIDRLKELVRELLGQEPVFRAVIEQVDHLLQNEAGAEWLLHAHPVRRWVGGCRRAACAWLDGAGDCVGC